MLTDLKDRVEAGEDESIARDAAASVYLGELRVKASSVLTCNLMYILRCLRYGMQLLC